MLRPEGRRSDEARETTQVPVLRGAESRPGAPRLPDTGGEAQPDWASRCKEAARSRVLVQPRLLGVDARRGDLPMHLGIRAVSVLTICCILSYNCAPK